jgi:predicted fused transcriptional regulator/phosphomethylpyrimidine kinase
MDSTFSIFISDIRAAMNIEYEINLIAQVD